MNLASQTKPLRIAVLGNSHVGCLKVGWERVKSVYPDINLTFFAARSSGMGNLSVEDGKLVPTNHYLRTWLMHASGGHDSIDPGQFDACLLFGLGLGFHYRLEFSKLKNHYSEAAYFSAFNDQQDRSLAVITLKKIRQLSALPVYLGHTPLRAYPKGAPIHNELTYEQFLFTANHALKNWDATVQPQPECTVIHQIYTPAHYTTDAPRMDLGDKLSEQPYGDDDTAHMNGDFGRLYLENFLPGLQKTSC